MFSVGHEIAEQYVFSGHLGPAVFEVVKAVNLRVKKLAGKEQEPDNASMMGLVFTAKGPLIQLADLSTVTGRDIQDGYMHMFTGMLRALRNPGAHEPSGTLTLEDAFERLGFLSMLMRQLDRAQPLATH